MNIKIFKSTKSKLFDILNLTFLSAFVLTTFYPFWHELCISFSNKYEVMRGGLYLLPRKATLDSYIYCFENQYTWTSYKNSIFITVIGAILSITIASGFAYLLSKKSVKGYKLLNGFVIFAMLFDGGIIPLYLTVKQTGLMNSLWILILLGCITPFNIIILRNFFSNLPEELEESAFIDGANPLIIFFKIVLPLSKPVLATIFIWVAVFQWNDFMRGLMFLNEREKFILPMFIRDMVIGLDQASLTGEVTETSSETIIAATIMLALVPILMVYPFLQKHFTKGIMVGAVKG